MNTNRDKPSLVLGASTNPQRYSNMAMHLLKHYGHTVYAIGNKTGESDGINIVRMSDAGPFQNLDTVTLYLNPLHQKDYYNAIIQWNPKRVIFNPGTENPEFQQMLHASGIFWEEACTLILLKSGQY